jgi:EAL domain-containing protein (putative c-di-GMP-specific phosphodiesterase class I)/GGDEF domain-containing protein
MPPPIPINEADRLAALRDFGLLDTPPDPAFDRLARLAADLLGAPVALISLIDEERQWLKSRIGATLTEIPREQAFCAHAIMTDEILVIEDAAQDARFRHNPLVVNPPHVRFYAGIPLRTAGGLAVGSLAVMDRTPRGPLAPTEARALRDLAALTMALVEAPQHPGEQRGASRLANRSGLLQAIDAAIAARTAGGPDIAVVVINVATLSQYAELVRTLGQAEADSIEGAFAARISERLPAPAALYHLSDARFGCVLDAGSSARMRQVLEGLDEQMRQPGGGRDIPFASTIGIGVACYPQDGADAADLLRAATSGAQEAMSRERRWCAYSPAFDLASRRASLLLRDFGRALADQRQLHLVYQPKTDLRTGRCVGAEALLRWTHPTLGEIAPGEAIPLIEQTTLVHALTDWELAVALPEIARLWSHGIGVPVSINISVLDLEDEHFVRRVTQALARHGVRPEWISIEVTESALMRDPVRIGQRLTDVRNLGVAIEIDDYGVGYSTLSLLKYIPATHVKIDQFFVARLASSREDQAIVRSTINLAHELGRLVVAEGIENAAQQDWLRAHDCDIGQGNALSPPLDALRFESWVRASAERLPRHSGEGCTGA